MSRARRQQLKAMGLVYYETFYSTSMRIDFDRGPKTAWLSSHLTIPCLAIAK
ncbi:MAG TPA: hypothetical protein VFB14_10225 [Bryobacteraceae bacterium]|nr:hypothetical protein [Bryobacteraceae bacterium]